MLLSVRLPAEDELVHVERPSLLYPHDKTHIMMNADVSSEGGYLHLPKSHVHGGHHLGVPAPHYGTLTTDKSKEAVTANGPTRIPLSQRRQPPPKLNLTLDLSAMDSSSFPASSIKRKGPVASTLEQSVEQKDGLSDSSLGIAASSGVVSGASLSHTHHSHTKWSGSHASWKGRFTSRDPGLPPLIRVSMENQDCRVTI